MTSTQDPRIYLQRHARLANAMQAARIPALALNPGPTLSYLTGLSFHLSERPVVGIFQPHTTTTMILPELEAAKAASCPVPLQVFTYGENPTGWGQVFRQGALAARLEEKKVGLEPTRMRVLEFRLLEDAAHQAVFISAEHVIADLRMFKDEQEQAYMRRAVKIAQDALMATLPFIHAGVTEKEIAAELTLQLLRHGSAPEFPFMPIIASGPNSANPHAVPTNRKLQPGDLLIIDWGASYEGIFSDLTRTFAIGAVDAEFENIARIVLEANSAGRAASQPRKSAGEVDFAARQVINAAGYGEFFIHRTGHGLGMDTHEPPYIFAENEQELLPGMTYTVEPGIYLSGRGGVRIEDNMLVTEEGAESFSDLPRELIRLD